MSTETDEKLYRAYRGVLRKQASHRAGARRNQARIIITERYGVSFQELKRIVADGDERHGVNHPHSPEYLQKLKFAKAAGELEAKHGDLCPECGVKDEEFVRTRMDPTVELFGTEIQPFYSCLKCFLKLEGKIASE